MDSNQPATKDSNVNIFQSQDVDNVSNSSDEDGGSPKRFKGEQLDPLKIGSILEKVFSNLDVNSIKNARLVNPLWSIEGAKVLIIKCYLKIPSNRTKKKRSNGKEMDQFKAFLSHKSSDLSMIPNITIDKVGDVKLWKSLGVLGQQVESLKLNIIDKKGETMRNLLDLLPNLKYLRTANLEYRQWTKGGFQIIKVLTSVMSSAEKDQSPLVISNINFVAFKLEQLENIEKFADCNNVLIEEIEFHSPPNFEIRISSLMDKLLSRSRNILKSLTLTTFKSFLPLLQFPLMPALTSLTLVSLHDAHDHLQPKFSPSFRFSEKIPNLIHFKYDSYDSLSLPFGHLFEQTGTAPSVKILEYHHYLFEEIDTDPLLLTFPNIEEYKLIGVQCSREMFESIWKYGANLRKLTFNIQKRTRNPVDLADLDSFITGFTRETVEKIKGTPNLAPYPLEEMEQLRVNPSILNLKHLEHFTITFDSFDQNDVPERFLATAGEYAFKLMPTDSKISICFHYGDFGRDDPSKSLLLEVSKLPNVTVMFEDVYWYI